MSNKAGIDSEKNILRERIAKKYARYKWADEQISFAFIAAIILTLLSRYSTFINIPFPIEIGFITMLSSIGVLMMIKKREWMKRIKHAEKDKE